MGAPAFYQELAKKQGTKGPSLEESLKQAERDARMLETKRGAQ